MKGETLVKKVILNLLSAYLEHRNVEGVLAQCTDDLVWIGYPSTKVAISKKETETLLTEEIQQWPIIDRLAIGQIEERAVGADTVEVMVHFSGETGCKMRFKCLNVGGDYRVSFFQLIVPEEIVEPRLADALYETELNRERFQMMLTNLGEVMYDNILEADITNDLIFGIKSDALAERLGLPKGVRYSDTIKEISKTLTHPDFAEEYRRLFSRENIMKQYQRGEQHLQYECREKDGNGKYRWIRITYVLYHSSVANALRLISYVKDIEEEKQAKEDLEKTSGLINKLVEWDYDLLTFIDMKQDSYETFCMGETIEATLPLEQKKFSEANRIYVEKSVLEEDKEACLSYSNFDKIKALLAETDSHVSYYRTKGEDGTIRNKKLRIFCLNKEKHHVGFAREDVTEIVREQERKKDLLEASLVIAKQASAAKSEFLSRMSHEIRTPMNAIIGMSAIAAQSMDNKEQVADCIAKIGISSRFLLSLINDILDMSRIESGKVFLKKETLCVEEFVKGLNTICYAQAGKKDVDYEAVIDPTMEEFYIADSLKLQQIALNIITNAIKFTEPKGKVNFFMRQLKREKESAVLRLVITDTGCGISEEFLPDLFEPFAQEYSGSTSLYGGTGLGLAICKSLVEMMDGKISVRSIEGVGSEFTVDVRVGLTEEVKSAMAEEVKFNFANLTALVVDDDMLICDHTTKILTEAGIKAQWVDRGEKAIERVAEKWQKEEYYDLILIDWKMPEMDGIETTRQIRKIVGPEVTIIIMTAYDWQGIEEEAKLAGVNLLMSKPMFKSSLLTAVGRAVSAREEELPQKPQEDLDFSGRRLLLAEDHPLNVEVARKLLEKKGFIVEHAENGVRALELFVTHPEGYYDGILMDIRMPKMDGLAAAGAIRHTQKKDAANIPIIAMTANAFEEDSEKSKKVGMNAHLTKPIDPKQLYKTLQGLIGKS
ncbi:MAG: response regulator [Anaerovoracaceae bacterium]